MNPRAERAAGNGRRTTAPKVSIGLPVFNGERYLEEALSSLLDQSFDDFELIVCDNASTDRTEEICRTFAAKDERVRYVRNRLNYGAAYNTNLTFRLSSGEYFKWAAHDDVHERDFLRRCVDVLDRDRSVVVCLAGTVAIDEEGRRLPLVYPEWDTTSSHPVERLRLVLRNSNKGSNPIWGLIRASVLERTSLISPCLAGDHVLLAELSLHGTFHELGEKLFLHRWHAGRYVLMPADRKAQWWNGPVGPGARSRPSRVAAAASMGRKRFAGYLHAIERAPLGRGQRARCYVELLRWISSRTGMRARRLIRRRVTRNGGPLPERVTGERHVRPEVADLTRR